MRGMNGWTWEDLERTPPYVRRFCADLLQISRAADSARRSPG